MRGLRQRLPWPSNKTYPLGPAVERLVAGIERRSPHVYGQRHVRAAAVAARPGCRRWSTAAARGRPREGERRILELGVEATLPVGDGGRADTAAPLHDGE